MNNKSLIYGMLERERMCWLMKQGSMEQGHETLANLVIVGNNFTQKLNDESHLKQKAPYLVKR
jgi:hypothetical protein